MKIHTYIAYTGMSVYPLDYILTLFAYFVGQFSLQAELGVQAAESYRYATAEFVAYVFCFPSRIMRIVANASAKKQLTRKTVT